MLARNRITVTATIRVRIHLPLFFGDGRTLNSPTRPAKEEAFRLREDVSRGRFVSRCYAITQARPARSSNLYFGVPPGSGFWRWRLIHALSMPRVLVGTMS